MAFTLGGSAAMGGEETVLLDIGHEVGGYRIVAQSSAYDGYAAIYRAQRIADELSVEIAEFIPAKIAQRVGGYVEPAWGADEKFDVERERFDAEAAALARTGHPNLAPTIERVRAGGTSYRISARARGSSLARILERAALSQREIVEILDPLLAALQAVHEAGCLHMAITPETILIGDDGTPLLTGVAGARMNYWRGLGGDALVPSEAAPYRAPEFSAKDSVYGPAGDIYAFAGVLHRAFTGQEPQDFRARAEDDKTVPSAGRTQERFRHELLEAIDAGLALDAAKRPRSVAEWRRMLRPERRRIR